MLNWDIVPLQGSGLNWRLFFRNAVSFTLKWFHSKTKTKIEIMTSRPVELRRFVDFTHVTVLPYQPKVWSRSKSAAAVSCRQSPVCWQSLTGQCYRPCFCEPRFCFFLLRMFSSGKSKKKGEICCVCLGWLWQGMLSANGGRTGSFAHTAGWDNTRSIVLAYVCVYLWVIPDNGAPLEDNL